MRAAARLIIWRQAPYPGAVRHPEPGPIGHRWRSGHCCRRC